MDNTFSQEFKELVSQSRKISIDLGYDYISTIHFFLADCESSKSNSLLKFAFKDENEFLSFKKTYALEKNDHLNLINDSIPLTKEAENTIRLTETERKINNHIKCYPFHFFIAALKNDKSLLSECFQQDKDALNKLMEYYKELGEYDNAKIAKSKNSNRISNKGILNRLRNLFSYPK